VQCRRSDGFWGWPEAAPYDGIIVTFAAPELPEALWKQLKVGGRIVVPLGRPHRIQHLKVITKKPDGTQQIEPIIPVRFVPMLREKQSNKEN
jgi:protein-L-isoaspartate(D-aspartate) O-methyltransferase